MVFGPGVTVRIHAAAGWATQTNAQAMAMQCQPAALAFWKIRDVIIWLSYPNRTALTREPNRLCKKSGGADGSRRLRIAGIAPAGQRLENRCRIGPAAFIDVAPAIRASGNDVLVLVAKCPGRILVHDID